MAEGDIVETATGRRVEALGARVVVELTVQAFEHGFLTAIDEANAILGAPSQATMTRLDEARKRHVARIREKTETEAGLR